MTDNLDIWNRLGRTDPTHTKGFKRAGGFSGTAVKPIYTDQKMTEVFGACGDGWGYSEPTFQLVAGPDGQTAVYCWLSVWYLKPDGTRSEPVHGVGGDFAVKKFSSGIVMDDEAFKKAFTDALGNAMKHLGMSADVHMGRFDDNKYVAELKREFNGQGEQDRPIQRPAPQTNGHPAEPTASQLMAREMSARLWKVRGEEAVKVVTSDPAFRQQFRDLDEADRERIGNLVTERRQA